MRKKKKRVFLIVAIILLLTLYGCAKRTEETPPPMDDFALSASFHQEDGIALCGSTVRFSYGEYSTDHSLDDAGDLRLTLFDWQEEKQGAMTLSFSEGAIIDATTDASGVGRITLRRDTDEVALLFTLRKDGSLFCALWLTEPDISNLNLSQEDH